MSRFAIALLLTLCATLAAAQEYRAQPGDTLVIEVLEDPSLNRSVQILPDGRFSFPFAGTLPGAGRTVGEIESNITSAIGPQFTTSPTVFVSLQPQERLPVAPTGPLPEATISIYFLGEVAQPGQREVAPGTTFLQGLSQAGGLTPFAATKRIQLRRNLGAGQPQLYSINYKALSNGAMLNQDPTLIDGDVILVPERRLFE
jgi:polysaccharide export outer membrane protein